MYYPLNHSSYEEVLFRLKTAQIRAWFSVTFYSNSWEELQLVCILPYCLHIRNRRVQVWAKNLSTYSDLPWFKLNTHSCIWWTYIINLSSRGICHQHWRCSCVFSHSLFLENVVKPLAWIWGQMGFQSQNCFGATRHTAQWQEHGLVGKIGNLALCLFSTALIFSNQELQQRIWGLRLTNLSFSATDGRLHTERTGNRYQLWDCFRALSDTLNCYRNYMAQRNI